MPYCTQAQLEERYGVRFLTELSDRGDVPPVAPDADLFARAIADADALIDGYLKSRYALPLASTPALVTEFSQRIAIYNAHAHEASDKITRDYELALRQLRDIADGKLKLDIAGVEPAGAGESEVTTNDRKPILTTQNLEGFV